MPRSPGRASITRRWFHRLSRAALRAIRIAMILAAAIGPNAPPPPLPRAPPVEARAEEGDPPSIERR
jgi:hypothetical protein